MNKISLFSAGVLAIASIFVNADETNNLVVNGNAADGLNNWKNVQKVVDGGPDGAKCFEVTGSKEVRSQEFIPVDAKSEYQLAVWLKSGNDKENHVFLALLMFDENKRFIDQTSVLVMPESETVLAAAAKSGETVIKLKNALKWVQKKPLVVAFDADDSGEYKDLPNYKYYAISNIEKKGDVWEATIAKPLTSDFPAETKVRAHFPSGSYMYVQVEKKNFATWTKWGGTIKPMVKSSAPGSFWPGTKYAQIAILANYDQKDGETLLFTNVSLTKIEPKKQ